MRKDYNYKSLSSDWIMLPSIVRIVCTSLLATMLEFGCGSSTITEESTAQTCQPGRGEVLVRSSADSTGKRKVGTFHSPHWPNRFEAGSRCVFRFVAGMGEKVHIRFEQFTLNGQMPICSEDFLDVYIDVASSSLDMDRQNAVLTHLATGEPHTTTPFSAAVYSSVLDRSALLGRYCGQYLSQNPIQFVSLHREIVLDFFANSINRPWPFGRSLSSSSRFGFNGSYEFFSDANFYPGRALSPTELPLPKSTSTATSVSACRFRIEALPGSNGESLLDDDATALLPGHTGQLISPTYPGYHPDGLQCAYQLVGSPGQRINVDVLDMDLPGDPSTCPTDYLLFHDGLNPDPTTSALLGSRFCGRDRRLRIVSSGSNLLIIFTTSTVISQSNPSVQSPPSPSLRSPREATVGNNHSPTGDSFSSEFPSSRRGFRLRYSFSNAILPIHPSERRWHLPGTECDYVIRSHGPSVDTFESPTSGSTGSQILSPNRACTFYFLGSLHGHYFEQVRLEFVQLDLPGSSGNSNDCDQGFLAVYGSRDSDSVYQPNEPDSLNLMDDLSSEHRKLPPDHVWCRRSEISTSGGGGDDVVAGVDDSESMEAVESGAVKHLSPTVPGRVPLILSGRYSLLVVQLNSTGSTSPGMNAGFRLRYQFDRTLGVPGVPLKQGACEFLYSPTMLGGSTVASIDQQHPPSTALNSHLQGWTHSPLYPAPYPTNLSCSYLFLMDGPESDGGLLRLSFSKFNLQTRQLNGMRNDDTCDSDYAQLTVIRDPLSTAEIQQLIAMDETTSAHTNSDGADWYPAGSKSNSMQVGGRMCGSRVPGPWVVRTQSNGRGGGAVLLRFRSGMSNSQSRGFSLHYAFLPRVTSVKPASRVSYQVCGANLSSVEPGASLIETLSHPNPYPDGLDCTWTLTAATVTSRLQLHFDRFDLAGSDQDCSRAIVRIYATPTDTGPSLIELCGNHTALMPIIMARSSVIVRFITTVNPQKATGFRLIWSELLVTDSTGSCEGFQCEHTRHCIPMELTCNGVVNCGVYQKEDGDHAIDSSDELVHCMRTLTYNLLHIGTGVLLTFVLLFGLVAFIYYRERKRKLKMPIDPLAELTGSKHSLASSHPASGTLRKSHRSNHCSNQSTKQSQSHSNHHHHHHHHHNHRSHSNLRVPLATDLCNSHNSRSCLHLPDSMPNDASGTQRRFPPQNQTPSHRRGQNTLHASRNTLVPNTDYCSRHQLIPVADYQQTNKSQTFSSRLQRRTHYREASHTDTLLSSGPNCISSTVGGVGGAGGAGGPISYNTDSDGGLLIRERMQKISIV